jgi:hypothetical protein
MGIDEMTDPAIISSNRAWHYRLITYVFSSEFFLEVDGFDIKAMDAVDMTKDFTIIYKKKPRTVNLCPYCRAVVGAVIIFPFVVLWRLFPHKEKKRTHAEIMKRSQRTSKIVRCIAVSIFLILGLWNIFHESYVLAAVHFSMAVFQIFCVQIFSWFAKRAPKRKPKPYKEPREPSKILKKLSEKHDLICPPMFFVDTSEKKDQI